MLLIAIFSVGCESDVGSWIDRQLRTDDTRRAHAATYAGIGTTQRAHQIAERIVSAANPSCAREAPLQNTTELKIRRMRGDTAEVTYRETRSYFQDVNGMARLVQDADFRMKHGVEGEFQNEMISSDSKVWVRDDRSNRWYIDESDGRLARLRALGIGQMQVLLNALPGLEKRGAGWGLGESALRCEPLKTPELSSSWLARLEGRGKVVDAKFSLDPSTRKRTYQAVWKLDQGRELVVEATESWSYGATVDMVPPAEDAIVHVERDRRLYSAKRRLKEMIEDEIVEREKAVEK